MPTTRYKTEEQREKWNAYMRSYRRKNKERVRGWRNAYILRAADRLRAEAAREEAQDAGD